MDRETKLAGCVVLISSLVCWAFVFYTVHVALRAHALGRSTSMEVVVSAVVCAVVLAGMAVYGGWIAYLVFFRFLTNLARSGDGYALGIGGRPFGHARQLTMARKLGVTELAVVRVDGRFWVCHWCRIAALREACNDSFTTPDPKG